MSEGPCTHCNMMVVAEDQDKVQRGDHIFHGKCWRAIGEEMMEVRREKALEVLVGRLLEEFESEKERSFIIEAARDLGLEVEE